VSAVAERVRIVVTEQESIMLFDLSDSGQCVSLHFGPSGAWFFTDEPGVSWMIQELHKMRFPEQYMPGMLI
jgi:hypothetical protein